LALVDSMGIDRIASLLGPDGAALLKHESKTIAKDLLHLPGPDFIDRVASDNDRTPAVLRNFQGILNSGRMAGTGYVSILPVDQGIEHSAGASFAPNPDYFDPKNIVELAIEGGCSAVASTYGVLGSVARKYAHKIPMMLKINHNELLSLPQVPDQTLFTTVQRVQRAVMASLDAKGAFVAMNNVVSQSVPHLHVHVVPRTKGDGLKGFFWPRVKYADVDERDAYASRIREALA